MKTTQFLLHVDGELRESGGYAHLVYDLGSTSDQHKVEEVYAGFVLSNIRNMDIVNTDFVSVNSARIEAITTVVMLIPELVEV